MKTTLKIIGGMVVLASMITGAWIVYEKWIRPKLAEREGRYITHREPDEELY